MNGIIVLYEAFLLFLPHIPFPSTALLGVVQFSLVVTLMNKRMKRPFLLFLCSLLSRGALGWGSVVLWSLISLSPPVKKHSAPEFLVLAWGFINTIFSKFLCWFSEDFMVLEAEFVCPKSAEMLMWRAYEQIQPEDRKWMAKEYDEANKIQQFGIIIIIGLAWLVISPITGVPALCFIAILYARARLPPPSDDLITRGEQPALPEEGIYHLKCRTLFGASTLRGVATVESGVMHTCYHVGSGRRLLIGDQLFSPSFVSENQDLMCWGGMPRITRPSDGEQIYVRLLTPEGYLCEYVTVYSPASTIGLFYGMRTRPGVSGSPFYVARSRSNDDGTSEDYFLLAGMIGIEMTGRERGHVDIGIHIARTVGDTLDPLVRTQEDTVIQLFAPCGSGKTRSLIPDAVAQGIALGKRVVISPPTRLICREVHKSLLDAGYHVSGDYEGGTRIESPNVVVIPHANLCRRIFAAQGRYQTPHLFIIDEAHSSDPRARLLVRILRNWVTSTTKRNSILIEMTATGYDIGKGVFVSRRETNYAVQDVELSRDEFVNTIIGSAVDTAKIMVFCPTVNTVPGSAFSIQQMETSLKKAGYLGQIVRFHRKTMESVSSIVYGDTDSPLIVLTTNMSEVGINPTLDYVFDCGEQLVFREADDGNFHPMIGAASEAQMVQRRGRVGRYREGVYCYIQPLGPREHLYPTWDGDALDAYLLASTLGLRPFTEMDKANPIADPSGNSRVCITLAQAEKYVEGAVDSCLGARLKFRHDGSERTPNEILSMMQIEKRRTGFTNIDDRDFGWIDPLLVRAGQKRRLQRVRLDPVQNFKARFVKLGQTVCCGGVATDSQFNATAVHLGMPPGEWGHVHGCVSCRHTWMHSHSYRPPEADNLKGALICPCCRELNPTNQE
jgi:hypothetical protein